MVDQATEGTGETLSRRLGVETQALHREAERTGIMVPLLRGRLDTHDYVRLLESLLVVYETLEEGLDRHAHHPALESIRMPELFRSSALRDDIQVLREGSEASPLPVSTLRYQEHLRSLSRTAPHLLGAHAWVRYMGDLSGGRMVGVVVARALGKGAPGEGGTRFYSFPEEVDPAAWKERFRGGLDAMPLGPEDARALVEEAIHAFRLHVEMFSELDGPSVSRTPLDSPHPPKMQ